MWFRSLTYVGLLALGLAAAGPAAAQEPDRIFDKSTVWRPLTPNDKLVVYGVDDPAVSGVACWYTQPEKGGIKGTLGLAEDVSDISLACRQTGPIAFKGKLSQGEVVFSERRSLIFKSMQIVRGCDAQAQHVDLHGLLGQGHPGFAEELDLGGAAGTLGHGAGAEVRGLHEVTDDVTGASARPHRPRSGADQSWQVIRIGRSDGAGTGWLMAPVYSSAAATP